jgi:hypothetical protein
LIFEIKFPGKSNVLSLGGDINSLGVELFDTDGQTDVTKLIFTFRSFANTPKNDLKYDGFKNGFIWLRMGLGGQAVVSAAMNVRVP